MKDYNAVVDKSRAFAVRIVRLYQHIAKAKKEFTLAKQLLRSGTGIGANVKEGIYGQSRADFISKMSIALKECSETEYWLELLYATDYLDAKQFDSIVGDCRELLRLLTAIIKTTKTKKLSTINN